MGIKGIIRGVYKRQTERDEIKIHKKKIPTGAGCFPAARCNACAKSGP